MHNSKISLLKRAICVLAICGTSAMAQQQPAPPPAPTAPPSSERPAPEPPTSGTPSTAPAVPVDLTSPRGAMKCLVTALTHGDAEGVRKVVSASTPVEEKMVDALAKRAVSESSFRKAALKSFGDAAKNLVGDVENGSERGLAVIDKAKESINGDEATLSPGEGAGGELVKLKKINGEWHIPGSEFTKDRTDQENQESIEQMTLAASIMGALADDITAGKFKTIDQVGEEFQNQMRVAAMKRAAERNAPTTEPTGEPSTGPSSGSAPATKPD